MLTDDQVHLLRLLEVRMRDNFALNQLLLVLVCEIFRLGSRELVYVHVIGQDELLLFEHLAAA